MRPLHLSIVASLAGFLVACGGGGTGTVSLMLKDAPGGFEKAYVTVSEVYLMGDSGKVTLSKPKTTTDLALLAGGNSIKLADSVAVPVGKYSELRFVITAACVLVAENGAEVWYASAGAGDDMPAECVAAGSGAGTLRMPSYAQSGLKVTMPDAALDVKAESKVILVDFSIPDSFGHDAGGSGAYVMHPVIVGAEITMSGKVTATVTSTATAPLGFTTDDCQVTLTPDGAQSNLIPPPEVISESFMAGSATLYPIAGNYIASLSCPGYVLTQAVVVRPTTDIVVTSNADSPTFGFTISGTITAVQ
jgi:Domain of unknown function (DUF4382)